MLYIAIGGGFVLIPFGIYLLVKSNLIKENTTAFNNQRKAAIIILLTGIGIIFLSLIFMQFETPKKPSPDKQENVDTWQTKNNETMAYVMMQEFVKDQLVSPSSAKFEWITEPACRIEKNTFEYTISSWVDSQNKLGVPIRTKFHGIIRQTDKDNWELLSLDFYE